jgi:hypothetical protein
LLLAFLIYWYNAFWLLKLQERNLVMVFLFVCLFVCFGHDVLDHPVYMGCCFSLSKFSKISRVSWSSSLESYIHGIYQVFWLFIIMSSKEFGSFSPRSVQWSFGPFSLFFCYSHKVDFGFLEDGQHVLGSVNLSSIFFSVPHNLSHTLSYV